MGGREGIINQSQNIPEWMIKGISACLLPAAGTAGTAKRQILCLQKLKNTIA